ncbi:diguanylate cyclase [Halomonas sp. C05BenzN]|uniref:sensor domain-containing diguanylate cyclase n=1 Tax=Halomonas sp. C05BenzN TaxID=3411041 RepID=UPI003B9408C5
MTSPTPLRAERLLAALAAGSRALMSAEHWSEGVDRLLAEIGCATGASRVWVFQLLELQPEAVIQDYVFEWADDERHRQLTQRRFRFFASSLKDPVYRRLVEERQRGGHHDIRPHLMAPGPLREHLESQSIRSMATVPIHVHGQWWGTLGIDDCERAISWEGPGLDLLAAASELIAAAIYRHQLTSRSRQIELFHKVADCGVWEVTLRNGSVWCSQALRVALGYPATYPRVPLRRLLARIAPEDRQRLWSTLRDCLDRGARQWRLDVRLRATGDRLQWHEIVAEINHDDQGRARGIAGLVIDISRRKQHEERALAASEIDELTGTLNRRGMARHLGQSLEGEAAGTTLPHHLLLIDIDHFKQINDRYGHPAGDALLKLLARRLRHELRPDDGLARLGGEEFAILVRGLGDRQAIDLADRVRRRIAESPFRIRPHEGAEPISVSVSISVGLAEVPGEGGDPAQRQALADQALYAAKHAGRNRTRVHREPA